MASSNETQTKESKKERAKKYMKTEMRQQVSEFKEDVRSIRLLPARERELSLGGKGRGKQRETINNTSELAQNPLTALFLARAMRLWDTFPFSMQWVWLSAVLVSAIIQWASCLMLAFYLLKVSRRTKKDAADTDEETNLSQYLSSVLSAMILFVYLLGEIRKTYQTYQGAVRYLDRDKWGIFITLMFISDILLHSSVAVSSVIAIATEDNISDKLQASLAFFFILEFDEYMFEVFINDYDVFDEEDFVIENEDVHDADSQSDGGGGGGGKSGNVESQLAAYSAMGKDGSAPSVNDIRRNTVTNDSIWDKKSRKAIRWGVILLILLIWVISYNAFILY